MTSRASRCGPRGSWRGGSGEACVPDATVGNISVYNIGRQACFPLPTEGDNMSGQVASEPRTSLPAGIKAARLGLAALPAFLSVNLWTGAPLFAIWCGSRVQNGTGLTMSAVGVVIGVLAVCVTLLLPPPARAEAPNRALSGEPVSRRTAPWMRSLRDERPELAERRPLSGLRKAMVAPPAPPGARSG